MSETPDPQQHQTPDERTPYGGAEWRRPDVDETRPGAPLSAAGSGTETSASQQPPAASGADQGQPPAGAPDAPGQHPAAPHATGQHPAGPYAMGQHPAGAFGTGQRPAGAFGAGQHPAGPYATGQQPGAAQYATAQHPYGAPWPYAAPARAPKRGRRLVAVGALTAVLGGLAGGGIVALVDDGNSPAVASSGIVVQGGSAPAAATQAGSVEAAAATASKSVVTLSVRGSQEAGTGSGIVLRADGYILTNEHVTAVASGGGSIAVTFADGTTATATIVGQDKATDLAVVKVNKTGLTAATLADSDQVKVGQTVVAVGSPLGLNGTVTAGIVSALHRPTSGASDNSAVIDALQTDAAINPGNSGGALVDLAGRVVGINQSIATAGSGSANPYGQQSESGNIGIGFAIPSDTAARVSSELIANGTATHAFLGVTTQSATNDSEGVTIGATLATVQAGGPAAAAGLKAGDVVTKLNDRVISQSDELVAAIRSYAPGTKVTLTVQRSGRTQTLTVTLGSDNSH